MSLWSKLFGSKESKVDLPKVTPTPVMDSPVATAEPEVQQPVTSDEAKADLSEVNPVPEEQSTMESEKPF